MPLATGFCTSSRARPACRSSLSGSITSSVRGPTSGFARRVGTGRRRASCRRSRGRLRQRPGAPSRRRQTAEWLIENRGSSMQLIESTGYGVRSAVLTLERRGPSSRFVLFPMLHLGSPEYFHEVHERLRACDVLVVEGVP